MKKSEKIKKKKKKKNQRKKKKRPTFVFLNHQKSCSN